MATLEALEQLLRKGPETPLLRLTLGLQLLKLGLPEQAVTHLERALELDPSYSAGWKALGRAWSECGRLPEALAAYRKGLAAAQKNGDKQAEREMKVFSQRIEKALRAIGL